VKPEITRYLAEISRHGDLNGGKARMPQLTPEAQSEQGRQAVSVRWATQKKTKAKKGKLS
jgi:hypothetical protein